MQAKKVLAVLVAAWVSWACMLASAHDAGEETTTLLQRQKLPDVPGKHVLLVMVSYAPGQASTPHFHAGSVLAYVLEGEVISQLEGQPPVTYSVGQSWFEAPRVPHLVSKNASTTKPAKLMAWLLVEEGGRAKEPLPKQTHEVGAQASSP
jgi:quercetin dioxygenase-like cupin family protein